MNGEATRDKLCKGLALDIRNNNQYFNIKKKKSHYSPSNTETGLSQKAVALQRAF